MCKLNKWGDTRIDPCMRQAIKNLQELNVKTLACCCGHGKYPMTIVVDIGWTITNPKTIPLEIFSNAMIERKKKFYKKDKQGYYFIPEALENLE